MPAHWTPRRLLSALLPSWAMGRWRRPALSLHRQSQAAASSDKHHLMAWSMKTMMTAMPHQALHLCPRLQAGTATRPVLPHTALALCRKRLKQRLPASQLRKHCSMWLHRGIKRQVLQQKVMQCLQLPQKVRSQRWTWQGQSCRRVGTALLHLQAHQ